MAQPHCRAWIPACAGIDQGWLAAAFCGLLRSAVRALPTVPAHQPPPPAPAHQPGPGSRQSVIPAKAGIQCGLALPKARGNQHGRGAGGPAGSWHPDGAAGY